MEFRKATLYNLKTFKFQSGDQKLEEAFFKSAYKDKSSIFYGKDYAKTFEVYYKGEKDDTYHTGKKNTTQIKDFDLDGDLDVLFYGRHIPGAENYNVILLFNTGKSYKVCDMGVWLDTMYSDSNRYYFRTSMSIPIDLPVYSMEYEIVKDKPDEVNLFSNELYSFYYPEDSLIKKTDISIRFPQKKEFYFRANPNLVNIRKNKLHNDEIIGIIPENTELHAYNYAVIDKKIWYYIVLPKENYNGILKHFTYRSYDDVEFIRGWVCGEDF